jgi:hypothetical protein
MPKQMPKPKIDIKVHSAMSELPMTPNKDALPKTKGGLLAGPGGIMVSVPAVDDEDRERVGALVARAGRSKTFRRKLEQALEKEEERVSRLETWADQVRDHLGDVKVMSNPTGPIKIVLTCEGGHDVEWASANRIPAEAIASKLKRQGWELGRHVKCPEHAHPRKKRKQKEGGAVIMTDTLEQAQASDAARTAKRLVILALDEFFNIEKGQYRSGQSDATIAKDLGIAEETVAQLRNDFCGPLKVPDEIEDVERQMHELRQSFATRQAELETNFEVHFGKLQSRLDALIRKNKWKADV